MKSKFTLPVLLLALLFVHGCSSITFQVADPESSTQPYQKTSSTLSRTIQITDARADDVKNFSKGTLDITLQEENIDIELISFLEEHLQAELLARGLDATIADSGDLTFEIVTAQMLNYRSSGFTPYVTMTTFGAKLKDGDKQYGIGVFILRAKTPIWSFNEVIEPTINQPLELLVNEIAAKINARVFGHSISDAQVNELVSAIKASQDEDFAYQAIYQLGFGNNTTAIPHLVEFSKEAGEYIRRAAISSLGILQATDQTDYLISILENDPSWGDKLMTLKALGDLGTEKAWNYLSEVRAQVESQDTRYTPWIKAVIDLYL